MVFPKKEKYRLQCEWAQCRQMYEDMDEFYKHLDEHFWTDIAAVPLEPGCTLICQWCECNFVTTNGHDLIRHIYFHGFHTKLKWLGFLKHEEAKSGECQIRQNRNIIPELPDGFKCCWEQCYIVVDIPDKFYDHVRDHAAIADPEDLSNGKKGFKCHWEGCNYEYVVDAKAVSLGRHKLRGHMITHTQERCYACPWCGNLYVNKTKLIDHFTRQINVENHSFQCTHCSRTFASERILKDHMRHHVNHYQCPKCAMTCPNPSALKHHIRYKHSTERPYACEFCDYRSKEPHDLQTHMQFHQSDLSYHCQVEDCDYVVRSIQNLRYHYRVKHGSGDGKYYACHKCDKKYGTGYQLTHHLRKVHNFQWPPGHCRFRYKECEDGMFRLQIFRYESRELTKQLEREETLSLEKETDSADNAASTSAHIKPSTSTGSKPVTQRMNTERRKKGAVMRKTEVPGRNLRSIARQVKKAASVATRKSPRKVKKTANVPPKRNSKVVTPKNRKLVAEDNLDTLPDLYINTECLEAADTLCNMRSNSVKKRKIGDKENGTNRDVLQSEFVEEASVGTSEASGSSVNELPSELSLLLDSVLSPLQTHALQPRNVGVTTRSSSSKKTTPSKRRFVKARKKLSLVTTQNGVSPKKTRLDVAQSIKDCSVDLIPLENPVFPDHHKLYCGQIPNSTKRLSVNLHDILEAHNLCQEGSPGSLLSVLNEDLPLLGATPQSDNGSVGVGNPHLLTTETIITTLKSPKLTESGLLTGETAGSSENALIGNEANDFNNDAFNSKNDPENEDGKLVQVNSSEIVTDGDGNRTVVNVGEEEFFLVSGTDTRSGGTVYCLVKSSEFGESDN